MIIENYGIYIEPSPKIYELYYRGDYQGEATHVNGDGLGLYVVKRISDMLELYIHHKCAHISDYNIGLIDEYFERGEDKNIFEHLRFERERLSKDYYKIKNAERRISISDIPLPKKMLEEDIIKPTYHVIFEFQIQNKSNI